MQFSRDEHQVVFDASTKMVLGDGSSALCWEDMWLEGKSVQETAPDLSALIPRRSRKRHTMQEALAERR